jgi:chemosensory pili system protein ChpC
MAAPSEQAGAIQAVVIPTAGVSLLVPGTAIAEVAGVQLLTPAAGGTALLGTANWRGLRVPVCSFERLTGASTGRPQPRSKVVVFYPLAGRPRSEFFAILSSADPRTTTVDGTRLTTEGTEAPDSPLVQESCLLDGAAVAIPDLKALRAAIGALA